MVSKMALLWLNTLLILLSVCSTSTQLYTSAIKTSSGLVKGTTAYFYNSKVDQYLGIPFAEPPVGHLRFRKSQPVKPWSGTLIADKPGPACVQHVDYPFPWYDKCGPKNESCLFINIWVPQSKRAKIKKPVMFWVHGGGYTVGSNQMPIYNGLALAVKGDIIVVTTNYRLSALGFLTADSETAPGNVALYDILEALKWINKNIGAFGGDPNEITLAGESVGAITAGIFCVSPLTKGLFKRVILEGGSPAYLLSENNTANIDKSQRLGEALGCANDVVTIYNNPDKVVDCLREKSADEIIITENSFHPEKTESYFPTYGDEFLPINPRKALIEGKFQDVDVLILNCQNEGSYLEAISDTKVFGVYGMNDPKINKTFGESLIDKIFGDFSAKDRIKEYYLGYLADDDYEEIRKQVYTSIGDYEFLCPTKYFAETFARYGNSVYYFFFVHRPSTTPWAQWMKVPHFSEVEFVFGQPFIHPDKYTQEEVILSSKIIKIWTNFVKYGSPESPDKEESSENKYPIYSETQKYVTLGVNVRRKYGIGPSLENCNFFRPFFGFISTMEPVSRYQKNETLKLYTSSKIIV